MKYKNKKHEIEYREVFLYSKILSYIENSDFQVQMSSPFKYKNGTKMSIYFEREPSIGIGQRNFQRNELLNNRGYLLLICSDDDNNKIVGYYSKIKNIFTLYITERIEPQEIKVLNIIRKYLTNNNVTVIIDTDEKNRYHHEIRRKRGDRVQYNNIEH